MAYIFNLWKHHLKETKKVLKSYSQKNIPEKKIKTIIQKLGENEFDLYTGELSIKEILLNFKNSEKIYYKENLLFICKDQSFWICKKIYKNNKEIVHFYPARKTIIKKFENIVNPKLHLRIHSNNYKTLILAYWEYLNKSNESQNYLEFIEKSREKLSLSKIDFNKSKLLEKFINLFISFD